MVADSNTALPVPSLAIDETGPLASNAFGERFLAPRRPVVMRGGAASWRATRHWSFEYIGSLRPDLPVVVEVGNPMQKPGGIERTTLQEYTSGIAHMPVRPEPVSGEVEPPYLAVFHMFDEIPELRADVDFGLLRDNTRYTAMVGWLGPAGTVTGYHADWGHNLFAQIRGTKRFHLVPPGSDDVMYPSAKYDSYSHQSNIDLENWDASNYPRYAEASISVVDLGPGDLLYIPPKWWHHVRSLEHSISANAFGYTLWHGLDSLVRDRLRRIRSSNDREHSVTAGRDI